MNIIMNLFIATVMVMMLAVVGLMALITRGRSVRRYYRRHHNGRR